MLVTAARKYLTRLATAAVVVTLAGLAPTRALAHPHVTVTAKSRVVAQDGKVVAIQHRWTFDEFYSSFLGQGLDTNKDGKLSKAELRELAKVNIESLLDVGYFTAIKAGGKAAEYRVPTEFEMESDGKQITLIFTLPLDAPVAFGKSLSLQVFDPSFFVAFDIADGDDAVTLTGAPDGCKLAISRPKPIAETPLSKLGEDYFANAGMGLQFATRTIVACP